MAEADGGAAAAGGRRRALRALQHPSASGNRLGPADPQARRPAPDGNLAAARHLCRRAGARRRRASRATTRSARPWTWWWPPAAASATRRSIPAILAASTSRADLGVLLNEKLTTELRPTLFLAQLSNLLAGNISIVHKVTGSSRTFMGEEGSGVSAVETAAARIRSGQSTHALVGGAFNTEHPDMLLVLRARRLSASRRAGGRSGIARGIGRRRRGQRLGRGLPGAGIARACRKARRADLCAGSPVTASGNARRDRDGFADALVPAGQGRRIRAARPGWRSQAPPAPTMRPPPSVQRCEAANGSRAARLSRAHRPPEGSTVSLRHRACGTGDPRMAVPIRPSTGPSESDFDGASRKQCWRPPSAIIASKARRSSRPPRRRSGTSWQKHRSSRPADRRRHRHRHRHLARRRQGRITGRRSPPAAPASTRSPAFRPTISIPASPAPSIS